MTATLPDVAEQRKDSADASAERRAAVELVRMAKEQGVCLIGPDGRVMQLTKVVLETALEEEVTDHLGDEHGDSPVGSSIRNGTRSKTVLTEAAGEVEIEVPRDREGSFAPVIVRERQRRLE